MWYDCPECPFASNSEKQARVHTDRTGHEVEEEED